MSKPREFWILPDSTNDIDQLVLDYEPHNFNSVHNERIHVIEYSRVQELEREVEKLRALSIIAYADGVSDGESGNYEFDDQERDEIKRARELIKTTHNQKAE
jgi:hypothetical protein